MKYWFEEFFNELYLKFNDTPERNFIKSGEEVSFLEKELALSKDQRLLDLCCGSGRHLIEFKKRGYDITGIDLSEQSLNFALKKALDFNLSINTIHGDIRYMNLSNFDVVYNVGTSFGYFSDKENFNVLLNVNNALNKKGLFALEIPYKEYIINNFVEKFERERNGVSYHEEIRLTDDHSRLISKRTLKDINSDKYTSLRLYSLTEIKDLLKKSGFKVIKILGELSSSWEQISRHKLVVSEKNY